MSRLPWVVVGLLLVSCGVELGMLLADPPTHATLPIFVPVSLEMERGMRAQRGQPAGRGGEEAMQVVKALEAVDPATLDDASRSALVTALGTMAQTRAKLLDARNRRHQLNVTLMNVGVDVADELDAAQWDAVQSRRDALRADDDAAVFERVLARLGG